MNKSDSICALAKALALAQGEFPAAKKETNNPFFNRKYADLGSVVDAIQGPLAKHGLSIVQFVNDAEHGVSIETVMMHESGEWIGSAYTMPVTKADAQGVGSAITYAKRYALAAICRLATEDDDGNAAAQSKPAAYTAQKQANARKIAELRQATPAPSEIPSDGPPPEESRPPDGAGPFPTLNAGNVCHQFLLCESIAEWSALANSWQDESHLHSAEDRKQVKEAADAAKKRLGKK